MRRTRLALLILLWLGPACLLARAANDTVILPIGDGVTWDAVFDAGFRPHHVRDGIAKCRQVDVEFGVQLNPDGEVLHLGRGDVEFSLRENHTLVLVVFYGRENRTVEEVDQKSERFARMFGEHQTKRSVVRHFEETGKVDYSDAVNHAQIGDYSILYNFSRSFNRDEPIIEQFSVSLKFDIAKRGKRLTEKIRPPAGYEHVSLEPTQDAADPKSEIAPRTTEREVEGVEVARPEQERNVAEDDTVTENKNHLLWIIGGLLLLGVVVILVRALRRGRAS